MTQFYKLAVRYTEEGGKIYHSLDGVAEEPYCHSDHVNECEPLAASWTPWKCSVDPGNERPDLFCVDSVTFAVSIELAELITARYPNQLELLPLTIYGEELEDSFDPPVESLLSQELDQLNLHLLHGIRTVTLNEDADVLRFGEDEPNQHDDVLFGVVHYAFAAEDLVDLDIFFQDQNWDTIVSDRFRDFVMEAGLKGVTFEPIEVALVN